MKRNLLLTLVFAFVACTGAFAQAIPNGDFENWSTDSAGLHIDNWTLGSGKLTRYTSLNVNTQQGQQTVNPPSGQYFIGLQAAVVNNQAYPGFLTQGFATTLRPKYFQANVMYLVGSSNQEAFGLTVALTKWDSATQKRVVIGSYSNNLKGGASNGTVFPFAKVQVELSYTSTETPDSAFVQFFSFRGVQTVSPNTALFVDKAEFTDTKLPTGIEEVKNIVGTVSNYPNPFSNSTTIAYELRNSGQVSLKVYDISGREVSTLVNVAQGAGKHQVEFNGSSLSEGVYIYQLRAGDAVSTGKMIISK